MISLQSVKDELLGLLMPFTDQHPTQRISIHPWKYNLRDMSRMLASEIDLSHVTLIPYTKKDDPRTWGMNPAFVIEIPVQEIINFAILETDCDDCRDAIILRHCYQQQLLLKES